MVPCPARDVMGDPVVPPTEAVRVVVPMVPAMPDAVIIAVYNIVVVVVVVAALLVVEARLGLRHELVMLQRVRLLWLHPGTAVVSPPVGATASPSHLVHLLLHRRLARLRQLLVVPTHASVHPAAENVTTKLLPVVLAGTMHSSPAVVSKVTTTAIDWVRTLSTQL